MKNHTLSDGEWKLMNLLWDHSPSTIGEMVTALQDETGWSKATINIMLTRLADKGAVSIDSSGRRKRFYPVWRREEAIRLEAKNCLGRVKSSSLGLLLAAMADSCDLSEEDIDELTAILRKGRRES